MNHYTQKINKKMQRIIFSTLTITVGILLIGTPLSAQETPEVLPVAATEIYNAQIVHQEDNLITINFEFYNAEKEQPAVRYGLQLLEKGEKGNLIIDEYIYPDQIALGIDQSKLMQIEYRAPEFLKGIFTVKLRAKTPEGLLLTSAHVDEVALDGTEQYVRIEPRSCYITEDPETEEQFSLSQGAVVPPEGLLRGHCTIKNLYNKTITVEPQFHTYLRTIFGQEVDQEIPTKKPDFTLAEGAEQEISLILPKVEKPQAYDATLRLVEDQKVVSNLITFHFIQSGPSATIQNVRADKESYEKGETANIEVVWSGRADLFGQSFGEENSENILELNLSNNKGKSCAEKITQTLDPLDLTLSLEMPITKKCSQIQVSAVIKDAEGNILDEKKYDFTKRESKYELTGEREKKRMLLPRVLPPLISLLEIMGLLIAGVALIGLSALLIKKIIKQKKGRSRNASKRLKTKSKGSNTSSAQKNSSKAKKNLLLLAFVLGLSAAFLLLCPAKTQARSFILYKPDFGPMLLSINIDQPEYCPKEQMKITAELLFLACDNPDLWGEITVAVKIAGKTYIIFDKEKVFSGEDNEVSGVIYAEAPDTISIAHIARFSSDWAPIENPSAPSWSYNWYFSVVNCTECKLIPDKTLGKKPLTVNFIHEVTGAFTHWELLYGDGLCATCYDPEDSLHCMLAPLCKQEFAPLPLEFTHKYMITGKHMATLRVRLAGLETPVWCRDEVQIEVTGGDDEEMCEADEDLLCCEDLSKNWNPATSNTAFIAAPKVTYIGTGENDFPHGPKIQKIYHHNCCGDDGNDFFDRETLVDEDCDGNNVTICCPANLAHFDAAADACVASCEPPNLPPLPPVIQPRSE